MWILQLNDMRSSKIEIVRPISRAETKEELINFLESEKTEYYSDGQWGKVFKKDGPLEWFNSPMGYEKHILDVGTKDIWMENAGIEFESKILSIPEFIGVPK